MQWQTCFWAVIPIKLIERCSLCSRSRANAGQHREIHKQHSGCVSVASCVREWERLRGVCLINHFISIACPRFDQIRRGCGALRTEHFTLYTVYRWGQTKSAANRGFGKSVFQSPFVLWPCFLCSMLHHNWSKALKKEMCFCTWRKWLQIKKMINKNKVIPREDHLNDIQQLLEIKKKIHMWKRIRITQRASKQIQHLNTSIGITVYGTDK